MWLFYIAVPLLILAIIAAIAGGGIFTLILVPLAVIAIIGGVWSAVAARAAQAPGAKHRAPQGTGEAGSELPHTFAGTPSRATTSPDALADARREAQ